MAQRKPKWSRTPGPCPIVQVIGGSNPMSRAQVQYWATKKWTNDDVVALTKEGKSVMEIRTQLGISLRQYNDALYWWSHPKGRMTKRVDVRPIY